MYHFINYSIKQLIIFWKTIGPESVVFNLASFNLQKKTQILNYSFLQHDILEKVVNLK